MAYDQYYDGSPTPGPVSGIDWTEKCILTTLDEVPPDKLILGVPFYVRCWQTKNGRVISSQALSMAQAQKKLSDNNASSIFDKNHKLTKHTWNDKSFEYVMWMEDAQTITQRTKLISKYGLSGIASWRRGFETNDIWSAIYNELHEKELR